MATERGRISHILYDAQRCAIQDNLAKARAFQGANSCVPCKPNYSSNINVVSESAYLISKTNCYNFITAPVVPESVRIARIQQEILNQEINPMNSNTRFIDYAAIPTIVPCPPITYSNGSVPASCPLPNTPLNPVLPV